jgi:AMP deaminase
MCELARNSVIQSGWENKIKMHWIGKTWTEPGTAGNDMRKTNVPNIRVAFRHETLMEELNMLSRYAYRNSETEKKQDDGHRSSTQSAPLQNVSSSDMNMFPGADLAAERARSKSTEKDLNAK